MKKTGVTSLNELCHKDEVFFKEFSDLASQNLRNRLLSFGFRRGVKLHIISHSAFKGTIKVNVSGCNIAVRKSEAKQILVYEEDVI